MPHFKLDTNVSKDKVTPEFLKQTSKIIASALGKPESYVVVHVIPDQQMVWGGTSDPCGHALLMSIGQLGVAENKKHSKVISDHLEKHLGIPKNRLYITFNDASPSVVGYNGSTFHGIL